MRKTSSTSSGASRRRFLKTVPATMAAGIAVSQAVQSADAAAIGTDTLTCAESVSGVTFSDTEHDLLIGNVSANLENYEALRKIAIDDELDPAFLFEPYVKPGRRASTPARATPHAQLQIDRPSLPSRPSDEDLAFLP